mgnify:CR=1
MKNFALLLSVLAMPFLFVSCAQYPPGAGYTPSTPGNRPGSAVKPAKPSVPKARTVSWKTVKLTGGESDLYVVISGRDYYLKRVKTFHRTPRGEYSSSGIPASAVAAGTFWDSDEQEDSQGIYAADNGDHVSIFTGYYAPGAMHDVRWKSLRNIRF